MRLWLSPILETLKPVVVSCCLFANTLGEYLSAVHTGFSCQTIQYCPPWWLLFFLYKFSPNGWVGGSLHQAFVAWCPIGFLLDSKPDCSLVRYHSQETQGSYLSTTAGSQGPCGEVRRPAWRWLEPDFPPSFFPKLTRLWPVKASSPSFERMFSR